MNRHMVVFVTVVMCAGLALPVGSTGMRGPAQIIVEDVGLQTPESVLHDTRGDVYLVSNINGNPAVEDNNGFISKVLPSGRVLSLKWIEGGSFGVTLNAPKGMAIVGGALYVTDITVVRVFDRTTGKFRGTIGVPGAGFLNDAAPSPDGSVYVTDTRADAIYRIDPNGAVATIASGAELGRPNGVTAMPDGRLVVVNGAGEMYTIGPGGRRADVRVLPAGGLDGIELLPDGSALVSSWQASAVFKITRGGLVRTVVKDVDAPADIGYDRKRGRILIPLFRLHRVVIRALQ